MRKINWDPKEQIVEPEVPTSAPPPPVQTNPTPSSVIQRVKNDNDHRTEMVRKLYDSERTWLKNKFLQKNGQIANDDCITFKGQMISECIAIFQITGYISVLHRYVALGRMELKNLPAYLNWMNAKYKGLWNQYVSQRFTEARRINQTARSTGMVPSVNISIEEIPIETSAGPWSTTPTFKAFSKRRSYCTA